MYRPMCLLETNDVAQVHRYLDLGARWEVCHGPADVLAAEAVREILNFNTGKPVVLAETGAVKPSIQGILRSMILIQWVFLIMISCLHPSLPELQVQEMHGGGGSLLTSLINGTFLTGLLRL